MESFKCKINKTEEKGYKKMMAVMLGAVHTHTICLVNNKIKKNKAKRYKLCAILAYSLYLFLCA